MESETSRLRFFAPDSHVLTNHATPSNHEDRDSRLHNSKNLRRLRAMLLKFLDHDELMLDLAFHRVMNISNRKSAEQFGIDPSVANRKGRRAVMLIRSAVLGAILVERITKAQPAILFPQMPQSIPSISTCKYFVPIEGLGKAFKRLPTEKQAASFIRRHREVLGLESEQLSESANVAIGGWMAGKGGCIRIGYVCSCRQTAVETAARSGADSIVDLTREVPTKVDELI